MRSLSVANPPTRWDRVTVSFEEGETPTIALEVLDDHSRTILARNDSPDVGFEFSVNPYRGCFHGCAYCFARPSHEYLSLGAGTDFERRIVVKREAPALLRAALSKRGWRGDRIVFSGVTDCYQPLEAKLELTRGCLAVCVERKNPVGIITKSSIVERDIDLLSELARSGLVSVSVSIPFDEPEHARALEPFVAPPERRFRIVERLAAAGIPVGVSVSPLIPGLNDESVPRVLARAREAGATHAFYALLRLPGAVAGIFEERLRKELPMRADKVMARVREARGGAVYDSRYFERQRGRGVYAEMIEALFQAAKRRLGFEEEPWPMRVTTGPDVAPSPRSAEPKASTHQLTLFDLEGGPSAASPVRRPVGRSRGQ